MKQQSPINEGPDAIDDDLLDERTVELVPCPYCGATMPENASCCPRCKQWVTDESSRNPFIGHSLLWMILALLGIFMFLMLYVI